MFPFGAPVASVISGFPEEKEISKDFWVPDESWSRIPSSGQDGDGWSDHVKNAEVSLHVYILRMEGFQWS